jgi:hypothetical protein
MGRVRVRPFADLRSAAISPASQDRLITGTGTVEVELAGADFEFVERAAIAVAGQSRNLIALPFTLQTDDTATSTLTGQVIVDTSILRPGGHMLVLTQRNGAAQNVPLTVHPPTPTIGELPLRANVGEDRQTLRLHGTALERVDRIVSPDAAWALEPVPRGSHDLTERDVVIRLGPGAKPGDHLQVSLIVAGLHAPVEIPGAVLVLNRRPIVAAVDVSFAGQRSTELRPGEVPIGVPVGFAIRADGLGSHPSVQLTCRGEPTPSLTLAAGQRSGTARLDRTGQNTLFVSLDPGNIVASGCVLEAAVVDMSTGASDPHSLGRAVRLPRIESFTLTSEKIDGTLYAGALSGESLELVERTGWTPDAGWPVAGVATPSPGHPGNETLRIALPWPSPSPQAPLYIWLRDETEARRTSAKY